MFSLDNFDSSEFAIKSVQKIHFLLVKGAEIRHWSVKG